MLDFVYLSGWGALSVTLFMFIPFATVFLFVIFKKSSSSSKPAATTQGNYAMAEWMWLGFVTLVFVVVNVVSISYMPTVAAAKAEASGQDIQTYSFEAQSWAYDLPEMDIKVGKPVRFSGKSLDTMHGFALYHPDGDVLFTMMLMPGMDGPTSLVHTFKEPGTYTIRCLEYCGLSHHEMRDELVVSR